MSSDERMSKDERTRLALIEIWGPNVPMALFVLDGAEIAIITPLSNAQVRLLVAPLVDGVLPNSDVPLGRHEA
jgi:hypothetical protein